MALNAFSNAFGSSSAPISLAVSTNRFDCAGLSCPDLLFGFDFVADLRGIGGI